MKRSPRHLLASLTHPQSALAFTVAVVVAFIVVNPTARASDSLVAAVMAAYMFFWVQRTV